MGISQAPGTRTIFDSPAPCRLSASSAPSSSLSVMKLLKRESTIAVFRPFASRFPSMNMILSSNENGRPFFEERGGSFPVVLRCGGQPKRGGLKAQALFKATAQTRVDRLHGER